MFIFERATNEQLNDSDFVREISEIYVDDAIKRFLFSSLLIKCFAVWLIPLNLLIIWQKKSNIKMINFPMIFHSRFSDSLSFQVCFRNPDVSVKLCDRIMGFMVDNFKKKIYWKRKISGKVFGSFPSCFGKRLQ